MIVHLHPSTLTPPPPQFAAAVDVALGSVGATRDPHAGGVLLPDGSEFELFLEESDDIALVTVWAITDPVAQALWAVLEGTSSFLLHDGWSGRTPSGGAVIPSLALAFPEPYDFANVEEFAQTLRDMADEAVEAAIAPEGPRRVSDVAMDAFIGLAAATPVSPVAPPPPVSGPPKPTLFRRIGDALFGKSV